MSKTEKSGEDLYNEKIERLEAATKVEKTDRVPIAVSTTYFPAKYAGISYEQMFYDNEKYSEAVTKFARDFNWDAISSLRSFESITLGLTLAAFDPSIAIDVATFSVLGGGISHDILGDKYSLMPGRELSKNTESQFVIKEPFINIDEYDLFLENPFEFLAETIIPRIYKNLEKLNSPNAIGSLIKLGSELGLFKPKLLEFIRKMKDVGCPPWYCALAPNPLDTFGAFLRNFDTLMLDLYRVPDKVKKICELLTPVLTEVGKATGKISLEATGSRRVFCPVWYSTYLSPKMYREFHWPYLKSIILSLIDAGFTPLLSLQGSYDHLLETILELPEKKVIAWFDKTNLRKAKDVIGNYQCIAGGISPSILIGGTENKVKEEVKNIMNDVKSEGGFIFTLPFNSIGDAKVENVKAMTKAVLEYGKY